MCQAHAGPLLGVEVPDMNATRKLLHLNLNGTLICETDKGAGSLLGGSEGVGGSGTHLAELQGSLAHSLRTTVVKPRTRIFRLARGGDLSFCYGFATSWLCAFSEFLNFTGP